MEKIKLFYTAVCTALAYIFGGMDKMLAILLVFIPAIGSYVIPQMLGGTDCVLIGNKIFMRAIQNRNIPHASALATLMAVSVLIPIALAVWWKSRQDAKGKKRLAEQTARFAASERGIAS